MKDALLDMVTATGFHRLFTPIWGGHTAILLLHRVSPGPRPGNLMDGLEVTPEYLERFIVRKRGEGWRFISLDFLLDNFDDCVRRKRNMVVTLDDGYRDNLIHGLPLFRRLGVPFTLYLTDSFPDGTAVMWWYPVAEAVQRGGRLRVEASTGIVDTGGMPHKEAFNALAGLLKPLPAAEQRELCQRLKREHRLSFPDPSPLSWEEVGELAGEELCTIGCHTAGHRSLGRLGEEEARAEMTLSKRNLETRLGKPVLHLAYPFGKESDAGGREERLAREAGFRSGVTTRIGNIGSGDRDLPFRLPRIPLYEGGRREKLVDLYLSGMYTALENRLRRTV